MAGRAERLTVRPRRQDTARGSTGYGGWSPEQFTALVEATPSRGLLLDTSSLGVDATVEQILARLGEARLDLLPVGTPRPDGRRP